MAAHHLVLIILLIFEIVTISANCSETETLRQFMNASNGKLSGFYFFSRSFLEVTSKLLIELQVGRCFSRFLG